MPPNGTFLPASHSQPSTSAAAVVAVDSKTRVDSPDDDDLDLPMDLINGLQSMGSTDLMLAEDLSKDELWSSLFGSQSSDGIADFSNLHLADGALPAHAPHHHHVHRQP